MPRYLEVMKRYANIHGFEYLQMYFGRQQGLGLGMGLIGYES
jgi:hypothetical protein